MLYVIMLAAGYGRRFQGNKLLHPVNNRPLYQHALSELVQFINMRPQKRQLIVVTQHAEIEEECRRKEIAVTVNRENNTGIASSIRAGIMKMQTLQKKMTEQEKTYLMFSVADQPYIKWEEIETMVAQFEISEKGIATMGYQKGQEQVLGNPVIFNQSYIEELSKLKDEEGGKHVLKKHLDDVLIYNIEETQFFKDIDMKSDL